MRQKYNLLSEGILTAEITETVTVRTVCVSVCVCACVCVCVNAHAVVQSLVLSSSPKAAISFLPLLSLFVSLRLSSKGQIPLRYPASEAARELLRELVCDLLASCQGAEQRNGICPITRYAGR